jgi:iron complex outermembrane receptor protein
MGIRINSYCVLFSIFTVPFNIYAFQHQSLEIPPVVISAKIPASYSTSGAPKIIISSQSISSTGVTSLAQALQELGGIQVSDITGNSSQVLLSMRGFGANANSNAVLLINGIPLTNPDLMPSDLNAIPLQEIEYIEIINGSEGVLYGDQAVGGTINIVTRHTPNKNIELFCGTGSYKQGNCYATYNNKSKQFSYGLSLLANHSNNYRVYNDYDQGLISGNAAYTYQSGDLSFDYKIINERMLYPGALSSAQVRQNRRQANNTSDYFKDWNGLFHLRQQQTFANSWQLQTDIMRRELHGAGVLMSPFNQQRYINFFKPQLKGTFHSAHINTGLDIEDDNYYLRSLYGLTNDSLQKYAAFGLINIPVNNKLAFSLGARGAQQNSHIVSYPETINKALATTIGVTYQVQAKTKLYLRRAGSFRFPNADENAFAPPGVNGLKTQKGASYETGIQWDWKNLSNKFSIYTLNLIDEISFDPKQTPARPFGSNRNLDPTARMGLSLIEKYQITDKTYLDGQYNYVNARYRNGYFSGNRIPLVSENIFHAGINHLFAEHWNIYTEAVFTGNQYPANDDANISGLIGGYTVYNFNLRYHFKRMTASFRVNNIFNKYYYFYTLYSPYSGTESFYPAPARNFMLTFKYVFV